VIIDTKDCDYILLWKGILDRIISRNNAFH
jgi:hypothetical protein